MYLIMRRKFWIEIFIHAFFIFIGRRACIRFNFTDHDAIKEHQAIFFDEEHEERLKVLRLEALSLMKRLSAFNPHLTGGVLDGTAGRYPTIHIQIYADSMKEVEFFLLNHNMAYETRDRKSRTKDPMQDKRITPILKLEGSMGPIELLIYHIDDLKINKLRASISETQDLIDIDE